MYSAQHVMGYYFESFCMCAFVKMYRYGRNAVSQHKVTRASGEDGLPGQAHGETYYRMVHMGQICHF